MLRVKKIDGMWRVVAEGTKAPFFFSSLSRKLGLGFIQNNLIENLNSVAGVNVWRKREN